MSRYNGSNGGSNGGNNDEDFDDTTLKLDDYAAVRLVPDNCNSFTHDQYGTSFIVNYDDAEVIDGVVLQREDKPGTWKVFSANKFFNLNPEDGLIYENFSEESGYEGKMSAQDILDSSRVQGYSTSAGGTDYFYEPVAVVVEEAGDIAVNDNIEDVETTEEPTLKVGEASMLLSNNSWVRTFAKKISSRGDAVVNDNGEDPTPRGEDDLNPKYSTHEWLSTQDPELRSELEGRTVELWVTEETTEWDDGDETTYKVPNLMDVKTGNFVTIDNGIGDGSSDSEKAAATDGGTVSESPSDSTDTESTESTESPSASSDDSDGLPENVPDKLEDLVDYASRNMDNPSAENIRDFAEDEVENPDDIDWEAAANEADRRSE